MPTNTVLLPEEGLSAQPSLADASFGLGQLFGLVGEKEGVATTTWRRSFRPGGRKRSAAPIAIVAGGAVTERLSSTYKGPRSPSAPRRKVRVRSRARGPFAGLGPFAGGGPF